MPRIRADLGSLPRRVEGRLELAACVLDDGLAVVDAPMRAADDPVASLVC
jgi:hypothetical protein